MGYDYGAVIASNTPKKDVLGADEIIAALDKVPRSVSNKILLDAHKTILKDVVRPDLKALLSSFSPTTRKGVSIVKAKGTTTGAYIGISTKAFWLRFVDKGTKERKTKQANIERIKSKRYYKVGRWGRREAMNRGRVQGDGRITNLLTNKANTVLKEVEVNYGEKLVAALDKELQRIKRKYPYL
jgi:hypothetical protein